ncbi:MAG: hypothetical protein GAK43_02166 [Stenotrophomonas maltophilia]|nr:MAG: hypothetical protein GAK43_02166 [Stenotrophomonas maltophilia]
MIAYCFEGRLAHQTLGMLLTRRLERAGARPLGFVATDYSLAVYAMNDMGAMIDDGALNLTDLFDEDMLGDDLEACGVGGRGSGDAGCLVGRAAPIVLIRDDHPLHVPVEGHGIEQVGVHPQQQHRHQLGDEQTDEEKAAQLASHAGGPQLHGDSGVTSAVNR